MVEIPFNRPTLIGKEITYLRDAIRRGQLSGDGYFTSRCNMLITELTGAQKVLLTHSCTAALEMAAILCDLAPGDEVIMPSFTFVSTANAVTLRGATPVFVDIDPDTLNIDPMRVADAITPRTRAIFAVHYAGFPADMDALAKIARAYDCLLVEDAAQALGASYKGRPCGSLGDLAAFSFHETKNVISGEGGALTINRPELNERAEIIREKGTNRSKFFRGQVDKYTWVDIGSSFLPGELIASYLCAQLEMAEMIKIRRLSIFERYMEAFAPLEQAQRVRLPRWSEHSTGNGHMFYLLLRDGADRDAFIAHMRAAGIGTPFHYVPLHSAPAGRRYGRTSGTLSITDRISETLVRLPMFFELGSQAEDVIDRAHAYFDPAGVTAQ
ncbi:dTDP-4-amino-4,6-dideoxygalactose transaminase [Microvirga arabica]|uniref:dTDP-4-amino-4,6-dideoxygalactose transaminase n=1 Tax=Microvirga arabica TaxID=1128671 RepID=UPI00193A2A6E|nr:dTDP-4-amino-4,6-dideoxygalactose transaminase [Microvirga arabica]MBM1172022.1 dTDP-4-amino-4,6-dideoxygalactose transaminase [Microvirga arabica]